MEFKISTPLLKTATKIVSIFCDVKSPIAAAGFVKITAYPNNTVTFENVRSEANIIHIVEAPVALPGQVGVSGKVLHDVVSTLLSEEASLRLVEGNVVLKSARRTLKIRTLELDKMLIGKDFNHAVFAPCPGLFKVVSRLSHCISKEDNRTILPCVYMEKNRFFTTDGKRLAIHSFNMDITSPRLFPFDWMNRLKKVFSSEVQACIYQDSLVVRDMTTIASVKEFTGRIPAINTVLLNSSYDQAEVDKKTLLNVLTAMQALCTDETGYVTMSFNKEELHLSIATEKGNLEDTIPCNFYKTFTAVYTVNYLIEALEKLNEDRVLFTMRLPLNPLEIAEPEFLQLLMPVKKT